jgi:membrane protease YdiL (CAAX protease family)
LFEFGHRFSDHTFFQNLFSIGHPTVLEQLQLDWVGGCPKNRKVIVQGHWCQLQKYLSTKLDSGSAFPFPLVYLVFTWSMSVLLSWAALRSGSVWPATIGHRAINGTATLARYLLKGLPLPLLGSTPTGLIGGLAYLVLALGLLFSRRAFAQNAVVERTFDQDKIAER